MQMFKDKENTVAHKRGCFVYSNNKILAGTQMPREERTDRK